MFRNRDVLIRNLATLFIVCNMIYAYLPIPPIVWRGGLVILCLYVILSKQRRRQPCEKTILVFVVFNLIHFFISYIWLIPTTTQIGNILCALLSLSLFAYLAYEGVMTEKYFTIVGVILIVAGIVLYNQTRSLMIEISSQDENTDITNGASMIFLFILPMLFLIKNNLQKWIMLMFCLYYLVIGAKRGNIIAAIIPIILYVFYSLKSVKNGRLKKIFIIVAIVIASVTTYNWFTTNEYVMYRLEQTKEGNSSNRDIIYSRVWNMWLDSDNILIYFFGYGFDGTLNKAGGDRTHNDWLEILVDYGLIGVFLYVAVFISLASMMWRTKNVQNKMVILSSFFIWLFKSAYSMGFSEGYMSLMMISLGTAIGTETYRKKMNTNYELYFTNDIGQETQGNNAVAIVKKNVV